MDIIVKKEYDKKDNVTYVKFIRENNGKYTDMEYWYEYDENNNITHFKNSNGYSYRKKYDENNNCILFKNSDGYGYIKKYDNNGICIETKDFIDSKYKCHNIYYNYIPNEFDVFITNNTIPSIYNVSNKYAFIKAGKNLKKYKVININKNNTKKSKNINIEDIDNEKIIERNYEGLITHYKDNKQEYWKEYNQFGNEIYYKDSNGVERWREYDLNGDIIYHDRNNGTYIQYDYKRRIRYYKDYYQEYWKEYDQFGNEIYYKDNKQEYWKEYDQFGNEIYYKDNINEVISNYNINHKLLYRKIKNIYGYEELRKYDEDGNLLYMRDPTMEMESREFALDGTLFKYTYYNGFVCYRKIDKIGRIVYYEDKFKKETYDAMGHVIEYEDINGVWFNKYYVTSIVDNINYINNYGMYNSVFGSIKPNTTYVRDRPTLRYSDHNNVKYSYK